ncbi:response regulator receiver protein [Caballeronia arationis]|uniref:response regulator n=1 Tax=Caballeronia arationis TaxID=1777142 RepID=UPI00074C6F5C|nr:response regulator [Caballeronia arationis]SAK96147.1 response regulator receiver protein [Caballeronia arationis]
MPRSHHAVHHLWTTRSFDSVEPPISALIVDDDSALAKALAQAFIAGGLRPTTVLGGAAALRATQHWTPHIVVLAIQMPSCDGFQVARAFRTSPRLVLVPVIAYTSLTEREIIERGKAAGIDAYCRKGDSPHALLRLIAQLAPTSPAGEKVHAD